MRPPSPRRLRVLLAEGNPLLRAGLHLLLEQIPGVLVSGEAREAAELRSHARSPEWDLLVLDLDLPGGGGFDLLRPLRKAAGSRGILVLSDRSQAATGIRALQAGAGGFLSKSGTPEDLRRAVERVASGDRYVSPAQTELLALPESGPPHEALSRREFQILCGIAAGRTGKELAHALEISPKTVCTYRGRLLEKLKMKSDADLIYYAIEVGLRGRKP